MKAPSFKYFNPYSPDEALALMQAWGEECKILAGGQTLMPMLNFRLLRPAALIDINQLSSLAHHHYASDGMVIGALTRQQELEDDDVLAANQPLVAATVPLIAHRAIRNRGTVGGSLAHADPAAEWGALILTLNAKLTIRKHKTADRVVAAANFFQGMLETALAPDELLVEIKLPPWPNGAGWSVLEFSRRQGDYALAGVACLVELAADDLCSQARLTVFGVGPRPVRLARTEDLILNSRLNVSLLKDIVGQADAELSPMEDNHASAEYRRHLTKLLVERAFTEALGRASASAQARPPIS